MKIRPKISLFPHQYTYVMSNHPRPALIAGYGSGKTFANIQRILRLLELRRRTGWIFYGAPTYDIISGAFLSDFINTLDGYGIAHVLNKTEHVIRIDDDGIAGTVKMISFDNYKYLVAYSATDGILDEFDVIPYQRQKEIWRRSLARLRGCENATLAITSTPEGYKLCYDLYSSGRITLINASTTDNKALPSSFIKTLYDDYDKPHQQMYIHGKFVNLTGLRAVYAFDRANLAAPVAYTDLPPKLTVGMDFNVDPFCFTVSCMIDGRKYTVDAFKIHNQGGSGSYASYTDKAMHYLLNKYPNHYYKAHVNPNVSRVFDITVRPDLTGGTRKTCGNLTDLQIIAKYGVNIEGDRHNPYVKSRLDIANVAMNQGKWIVTENCKELIEALEQTITDTHGELIKPKDDDKSHLVDAVTYDVYYEFKELVFNRPKWTAI